MTIAPAMVTHSQQKAAGAPRRPRRGSFRCRADAFAQLLVLHGGLGDLIVFLRRQTGFLHRREHFLLHFRLDFAAFLGVVLLLQLPRTPLACG